MSTNFTGGARNAHKRFSTRTSQDITGTPVYQQVRRGAARSGGQIYSSRRNDHHQSGAKRRKTGHGLGNEPEFQFAHARRDQEERKRTEAYLRKRSKGRRRDLDPDGDEVDALQRYDTVSAYPPLENAASFSSASRAFPQTQHYALEDDPDSADRFSRIEFPLPNRLSPVRLGTSGPLPRRVPGPLTPRRTGRVIVPHPQTIQHESARLEDYCPVPSRPATQLSSYSSNTATLSIIHSSPVQPPLRSTTPLGSPPPLSSYNQAFGTTSARSNWSTQTNAPASTSQSSPRSDAGPKKFASSKQQLTTKEPESEHLDSSLSRLQISRPSDSPPSDPFDTLLDRFERIVAKPCTTPVAPPRAVDRVGPCCATQYQRDQLAHSFIFDRAINEEATTVKAEVEEDAVFVSDRMGLGCKAISKTDAIELVRLELALRGTPLNPEPEEIVDDQKLFESLDWDEADFADDPRDGLLLSSDSRRPPDPLPLPPPPLADPTPPKHVSGTTAMLSNGPWNAPADEDELSSVDDLHLTSSDSGTATLLLIGVTLNDLGDYEDVSARRTLPRYQTAYEPESIRAVGIEGEEERDSIPDEITGVEEVVEIR